MKSASLSFTAAECAHLLNLLSDAEKRGHYYGPREQYWARHKRIENKIREYIKPKEANNGRDTKSKKDEGADR
ncbi:MAG: hypothetical protein WC505_08055 [Patescibacteria group bacterium]